MKAWKDILLELAKKLTAPLAFAALFVVLLSQFGDRIPPIYVNLVYDLGLGALALWALVEIVQVWRGRKDGHRLGKQSVLAIGKNSQVKYIVNNYYHSNPAVSKEELETQVKEYLDWVQESFGTITLRGIEQGGKQVVTLPLETVYVPLAAEYSQEEELGLAFDAEEVGRKHRAMERMAERRQASSSIKLNQILSLATRLIVTGGPGSGKTTVLQHIAWSLAYSLQTGILSLAQEKLGVAFPLPLPIYVPLSLYAAYLRDLPKSASGKERSLATFVSEYLLQRQMHLNLSPDFIAHLLREEEHGAFYRCLGIMFASWLFTLIVLFTSAVRRKQKKKRRPCWMIFRASSRNAASALGRMSNRSLIHL